MSNLQPLRRRCGTALAVVTLALFLGSCDLARNQLTYDRSGELDRQDYREALGPVALPPEDAAASIPAFQPVISTPEDLKLPSPLVTVSVNNTVSLRDLMFELAEQADVDLELDPQIRGSMIFTAKQKPFDQVIDRICAMTGLRYKFDGEVLRVELDRPYIKNYNIGYLNVLRTAKSNINAEVTLGTSSGSDSAATSGGSSSEIKSEYEADIWEELQESLQQLLASSDLHVTLATTADPVATPISTMPPPLPVDPNNPGATQAPLPGAPSVGQMPPAMVPNLQVSSVKGEPLVPNSPSSFSISKQSGMVSVFAPERTQKIVERFMDEFRRRTTTQIVIEAKVLQVDLSDEYVTGVDWSSMNLTGIFDIDATLTALPLTPNATGGVTGFFKPGSDFSTAISALGRFGTVRALSSPRVTVLNNTPALVNVAENNIYFNYDVETNRDDDTNLVTVSIESEQRSTPEGVILSVVPTANPDTGEILLSVRPTVSKITTTINDPTIVFSLTAIGASNATIAAAPSNAIPQVAVQEIDSVLRLQSGQIAVMGGLMKDSNTVDEESVPVLGDFPLIGAAFKSHRDVVQKSELVIFMKASIAPMAPAPDATDKRTYETFGLDRRPERL